MYVVISFPRRGPWISYVSLEERNISALRLVDGVGRGIGLRGRIRGARKDGGSRDVGASSSAGGGLALSPQDAQLRKCTLGNMSAWYILMENAGVTCPTTVGQHPRKESS
ncbi:hypothetical protein Tco_0819592 [Tanacetum coccineum]|uniref:Uncharacterized protein n=1 Tax=Tanacetum coccineum TaxID=301880 RepID=A0ABQ5AAY2_9ASTR